MRFALPALLLAVVACRTVKEPPGTHGSAWGGDGGDGRVRLDVDTLTGTTAPAAGHTTTYED